MCCLKRKFERLSPSSKAMYLIYKFEDVSANKAVYKSYEKVAFYFKDVGRSKFWIAVDNTTGDCWVEQFDTKEQAEKWIDGKIEL